MNINLVICLSHSYINLILVSVTRIQFSSANFSGSESSGVVLIGIEISGAKSTTNISVNIELNEMNATGIAIAYYITK